MKKKEMLLNKILRAIMYCVAKATSYPVFFLLFRCKIIRTDRYTWKDLKGSIIYANHSSYLDPLLLIYAFPMNKLRFVINRTVCDNNAFLRWILNTVGCISIDKENFSLASLAEIMEVFSENKTLVIFPEGQINYDGDISRFRDGMALIAYNTGAELRPVYIHKTSSIAQRQKIGIGAAVGCPDIKGMPKKSDIQELSGRAYDQLIFLKKIVEG